MKAQNPGREVINRLSTSRRTASEELRVYAVGSLKSLETDRAYKSLWIQSIRKAEAFEYGSNLVSLGLSSCGK
jgi:hypothetical protein